MNKCTLCPRECGVTRDKGEKGYCGVGGMPVVARAMPHFGEEPCISGTLGSGAVFFSGCNLGCCFCQNYEISHGGVGREITVDRLREIYKELEAQGVHNINLVTPTHFADSVLRSLDPLPSVPVVYNCEAYEKTETLRRFEGKVSVYLPDMKYSDDSLAIKYSSAPRYFETAKAAILEMFRQTGPYVMGEDGLLKKGIIIRHLILPGNIDNSIQVLDWIADAFPRGSVLFSLMSQYTPHGKADGFGELNRRLRQTEYNRVEKHLFAVGIEDGFLQELDSAGEEFIPGFDFSGV